MKTKTVLSISVLFLYSLAASSQVLNYKKLIAEKEIIGQDVFLSQLREYQRLNKEFSNAYYQIGKIELNFFSNLDPLVDRVASRQYVYNSKTNFSLARNFVIEKEVTKNPNWYDVPSLKDKDSIVTLAINLLDEKYQSTIRYTDAYELLLFHYDKAVAHYIKARQDFIAINTSAENLRQLFLQTNDSLKQAIQEVGVSFDSSMHHLDIYRNTYQLLPHAKKRKVIVNFNTIDHFRMNGITPTNFLADNIDVWDYKMWSDDLINLIKDEVDGLKDEIKTAYEFFTATNNRLVNGDECIQANVDDRKFQRIINLVTKYDNQSILIDIFTYLLAKLEYGNQLTYERNCNLISNLPTTDFISRKARIYQALSASFNLADSLNNSILKSERNQQSFEWFFSELMSGQNSRQDFGSAQEKENKVAFKNEVDKLNKLSRKQSFQVDSVSQCYRIEEDQLFFEGSSESEENFCVTQLLELADSLVLLVGKKGEEWIFMGAQKNEDGYGILWDQSSYKNSKIDFFKVVSDSSFVIGGISKTSWIKHIGITGIEKKVLLLKSADTIVNVDYNELQGAFTIIQANDKKHTLSTVDFSGKTTYRKTFDLQGKFLNMWRQEQSYWFFSHMIENEKSVVTASVFDLEADEFKEPLKYSCSYLMINPLLIKNDNESITLLATNSLDNEELIYSLLDYLGTIRYEEIF